MRGTKAIGALCAVLAAAAAAAPAAAVGGPANWMYEPTSVVEIHLELPPASITALEAEPKEYVEGTFSLAGTNGTPGTAGPFSAPLTVGIELKGSIGSLRRLSEKAAFKIKFDKFVAGQSFLGLEKMTLNNMVQDPSMVHETTTYEAFHAMGVPAPHTGFAYLTVNGQSYGMHLNIETQDAQSLENEFGIPFAAPQHLYSGEYGADVNEELLHGGPLKKWEAIEVSEGKKTKKEDLEALVAAVEAPSPAFGERLASVADLAEMTKNWLVEKYVGNWDGYAGGYVDYYHPNNYYLYGNGSGVFRMMPWGTDQTWQTGKELDFGGGGGILVTDCLADTAGCRATYLAAGRQALTALDATDLDTVARCAAAELRPWQELEAATSEQEKLPNPSIDGEENLERAAGEVAATQAFIASRPRELAEFLGEPTPPPPTAEPACPPLRRGGATDGTGSGTSSAGGGTAGAPSGGAAVSPAPSPQVSRIAFAPGSRKAHSISLRLQVTGPGRVVVRGSYGRDGAVACRGAATATAAGEATVVCRFTRRFAALLASRWRRIHVTAGFAPSDGSATADHLIRLRKG